MSNTIDGMRAIWLAEMRAARTPEALHFKPECGNAVFVSYRRTGLSTIRGTIRANGRLYWLTGGPARRRRINR